MNVPIFVSVGILCLVALVLISLCFKQLRGVFALFFNTFLGWAGLYIFNLIFAASGFAIGINIASASIVGILGVPGLILLIILKLIYK